MMNADDTLRRALASFDAASFANRHGGYKESISPLSHEYLLPCPCGGQRLRWNAQKGTWICWSHPSTDPLGASGDTIKLICLLEGVDESEAIGLVLAGYVGGDSKIERLAGGLVEAPRNVVRRLPRIPWPDGVDLLSAPCEPHQAAWSYLAKRGITAEQVKEYQIGFGRYGKLENYIVFPVWMDRTLVFYQGRATWDPPGTMVGDARKAWIATTGYRKTLNPPTTGENATGSEVIFNADRASTHECVVVCEGPVDAIKCGPNAVALFGKVAQPAKVERLKRMSARMFVIYLDRGEEEARNAEALAKELSAVSDVFICVPPPGHDAGSLTLEQNQEVIRGAKPFTPGHLTSRLTSRLF